MITEIEILEFARTWFDKLNKHVPLADIAPMLAPTGLLMKFPDSTITNIQEFETWYTTVCGLFFNEEHIIRNIQIVSKSETSATITVYVNWIAHTWKAPDAKSNLLNFDAFQSWELTQVNNQLRIQSYIVNQLIENK